jgi:bifunctional DNA-binding transcriptional regulator/antitoxin component of YhaV-PrlF toxin-antitoxin module
MPVQPAFLTQNRHGIYYFRIVIPKPLRAAFGLQREIRRTLKTDSARLALCSGQLIPDTELSFFLSDRRR